MDVRLSSVEQDRGAYRVLVVDDEPIVHQMMARIVASSGLPLEVVGFASSGAEALAAARNVRPDICLLDIQMDDMTGLELTDSLQEVLGYRPAIVYVTAHRKFEYAREAVRVGAVDYLVKPISTRKVITTLARAVGRLEANRLEHLELERLRHQLESVLPATVSSAGPADTTRRGHIVRAVRDYIDTHFAEPLGLSDVADHLNLSPGYIGSLFKAEYGISFKAYLRRVRVARAKELMQDPRLNLTEVARLVGYADISYFSQSFVQETGVRPSEYRGGGRNWPRLP